MKTKLTDGGRFKSGYILEKRDCTVRALAIAADIPYTLAHDIAQHSGRKMQRGWFTNRILPQANAEIGLDFTVVPLPKCGEDKYGCRTRPTVNQVVKTLPPGRFIIETRTHAMAVIDGVAYDRNACTGRARVEAVYEIIKVTQ